MTPAEHDQDHRDIARVRRLLVWASAAIAANAATLLIWVWHGTTR